jgi:hypothetical protein
MTRCSNARARKCPVSRGTTTAPPRAGKPIGFGNCWVVAGIVVELPFLTRPVCLPVLARLWRPRRTGKIAFAREMVEAIAARYPDRTVHAVGDAAYVGEHLRGLSRQITWTSRLKVTSVLHELPPAPYRKIGATPHQGRPAGHPGRPRGHRDVAHHQGPPLRPVPTPCRSPKSCACGRLISQPNRACRPGPRQQAMRQRRRPRLRTATGHHRPDLFGRRPRGTLRRPVVHRGRVLATPARSWVSARPATAPAKPCTAPCRSG